MKRVRGIMLPDSEQHLVSQLEGSPEFRGAATYQLRKYLAALEWCGARGHAVDVGAHVGLWSRVMAADFREVTAFEALKSAGECWSLNMLGIENATLHLVGIADRECTIVMRPTQESTGDSHVLPDGAEVTPTDVFKMAYPLDDLLANASPVDFLKLDLEGFEVMALRGGEQIIRRDRPVVVVEQKPGKAQAYGLGERDAVDLLESWGATLRVEIAGDFILSWDR